MTAVVASFGGIKLNDTLNWNRKITHFGELRNHFSKHAPKGIREGNYVPKWEDDEKWKKVHKRYGGKITHNGSFGTYQEMRDACYGLIKDDKEFLRCDETNGWCGDCILGNDWDLSKI